MFDNYVGLFQKNKARNQNTKEMKGNIRNTKPPKSALFSYHSDAEQRKKQISW